jgi:hypothetical protein
VAGTKRLMAIATTIPVSRMSNLLANTLARRSRPCESSMRARLPDRSASLKARVGKKKFRRHLIRRLEEFLDLLLRGGGSLGIIANRAEAICHLGG